jgi:hypothetical protein
MRQPPSDLTYHTASHLRQGSLDQPLYECHTNIPRFQLSLPSSSKSIEYRHDGVGSGDANDGLIGTLVDSRSLIWGLWEHQSCDLDLFAGACADTLTP